MAIIRRLVPLLGMPETAVAAYLGQLEESDYGPPLAIEKVMMLSDDDGWQWLFMINGDHLIQFYDGL